MVVTGIRAWCSISAFPCSRGDRGQSISRDGAPSSASGGQSRSPESLSIQAMWSLRRSTGRHYSAGLGGRDGSRAFEKVSKEDGARADLRAGRLLSEVWSKYRVL